jgi:hypothetical protein
MVRTPLEAHVFLAISDFQSRDFSFDCNFSSPDYHIILLGHEDDQVLRIKPENFSNAFWNCYLEFL